MKPAEILVKSINPCKSYLLYDLVELCEDAGFNMLYERLRLCVKSGKIKAIQPGGKHHQYEILGQDFVDFFLQ